MYFFVWDECSSLKASPLKGIKWYKNFNQQSQTLKPSTISRLQSPGAVSQKVLAQEGAEMEGEEEAEQGTSFPGENPPAFSVVEFISCTLLPSSCENSLAGGCIPFCYCLMEGIKPLFPSRSSETFDNHAHSIQYILLSLPSVCSEDSFSLET